MFHAVGSVMCNATVLRTPCCGSTEEPSIFITLLTAKFVRQQYNGNVLLGFHGKNRYANALQCYVTRALPTLLVLACGLWMLPEVGVK